MNLLIMGPAGSGKGTMSAHIVELFNVAHISTGDMFREAISNATPVGIEAKSYIDQGKLVPDEVTDRMVKERISKDDCLNGYLLDGYPRNLHQAEALEVMSNDINRPIDLVINLEVEYEELVKRITGRRLCKDCGAIYHIDNNPPKVESKCDICGGELYQRSDDNEEKLQVRFEEYINQTKPVIDYYREKGLVRDVNASQPAETVMNEIKNILEAVK
ncbi:MULTISPECIES: adenylate kinase [Erysipelothrix]|uniref:Adenylate kinase n=1 Tax=Erysipelothrix piscisicarius TaxID=2485784 RepID=A0A3S8RMC8_9FIRM|nr:MULTISPECIES: adenylate kinase [Erysipelothrix]AZK44086.1 adenylate kinase [Erysipelothrix piscisicarius]MBK2402783.1 adenylate kinase [Erysipelothrix sp. strain 2 (EsS2-6-Brazil)]MBK2404126.1 adenylate kinase [Erysipelothrix sp. strain 2 (EsS2-7-Brazil)]NBA01723.1 adenylate kinase [Erysipelothrix rhusiopathiae]